MPCGARSNEGFLQSTTGAGVAQHGKVKHLFAKDKGPIWQKNPLSKAQTLYEAALDLESFAMASDVARYALLHKHGGVYLDVDLGPGAVTLRPGGVMMPLGDDTLPMFGPLLQDLGSVRKKLKLPDGSVPTEEQIQQAAAMAYEDGDFGNHFIVAHPGSAFMKQVLDNLPDYNTKDPLTKGYLVADMKSKNVAAKTGPLFLVRQFIKHAGTFPPPGVTTDSGNAPAAESDKAAGKQKFTPAPHNRYRVRTEDWADWARLEWLTSESENQEAPTTTSAPARQETLAKRIGGTVRKLKNNVATWGSGRTGSGPTLSNDGTLLTGFDPASDQLDPSGGAPQDELVGKDGRKVSFEQMRQSLREIRDASGRSSVTRRTARRTGPHARTSTRSTTPTKPPTRSTGRRARARSPPYPRTRRRPAPCPGRPEPAPPPVPPPPPPRAPVPRRPPERTFRPGSSRTPSRSSSMRTAPSTASSSTSTVSCRWWWTAPSSPASWRR